LVTSSFPLIWHGGEEVAFQANTGHLFIYYPSNNSHADSNLGMAGGTSPSIAALNGSVNGYGISFQANTGHLFVSNALDNSHADTAALICPRSARSVQSADP
jgi:hypothetical protein